MRGRLDKVAQLARGPAPGDSQRNIRTRLSKKLFVKTYGCQMNVYDSESHGRCAVARWAMRQTETIPPDADFDHPEHLPHPREGCGERSIPSWDKLRALMERHPPRDRRGSHDHRRRRLRRPGRGRGDHEASAGHPSSTSWSVPRPIISLPELLTRHGNEARGDA